MDSLYGQLKATQRPRYLGHFSLDHDNAARCWVWHRFFLIFPFFFVLFYRNAEGLANHQGITTSPVCIDCIFPFISYRRRKD